MEDNGLKDDELWQRIAKIRQLFCDGKNTEFAAKIGKDTTYTSQLCNGSKPAGKKMLEIILDAFPEVRPAWLYLGEEPMYNTNMDINKKPQAIPKENYGIIVQHGGNGDTYNNHPDLMQVVLSQQKTIQELTEQNKILTQIIANKL